MSKLRDDLVGVVYVDGEPYGAGDELPGGAVVSASLTAPEASPVTPARSRRRTAKGA